MDGVYARVARLDFRLEGIFPGDIVKGIVGSHNTRQSTSLYSHNLDLHCNWRSFKLFVLLVTENRWTCILAHVDAANSIR